MITLILDPDTKQIMNTRGDLVLVYKGVPLAAYEQGKRFTRTDQHYDTESAKRIRRWQGGSKVTIVPQAELAALLN